MFSNEDLLRASLDFKWDVLFRLLRAYLERGLPVLPFFFFIEEAHCHP
jgi:hypothetical protein